MSILIDQNKCVGCKQCLDVCPGNLIASDVDGRAYIRYPRDCWGCSSCVKECKFGAIAFYLGADIGGQGSKLKVRQTGDILEWRVEKITGEVVSIPINRKDSNKY